jgi:hypothetical protein
MEVKKEKYLVCYDYGTGGLWGAILAENEAEILAKYPELTVVPVRPSWMTDEDYEHILRDKSYPLDAPPAGILKAVIADRKSH